MLSCTCSYLIFFSCHHTKVLLASTHTDPLFFSYDPRLTLAFPPPPNALNFSCHVLGRISYLWKLKVKEFHLGLWLYHNPDFWLKWCATVLIYQNGRGEQSNILMARDTKITGFTKRAHRKNTQNLAQSKNHLKRESNGFWVCLHKHNSNERKCWLTGGDMNGIPKATSVVSQKQ